MLNFLRLTYDKGYCGVTLNDEKKERKSALIGKKQNVAFPTK